MLLESINNSAIWGTLYPEEVRFYKDDIHHSKTEKQYHILAFQFYIGNKTAGELTK